MFKHAGEACAVWFRSPLPCLLTQFVGGNSCEAQCSIPKLTQQVRHWSLDPTIVSFNATIETMKRAYEWWPGMTCRGRFIWGFGLAELPNCFKGGNLHWKCQISRLEETLGRNGCTFFQPTIPIWPGSPAVPLLGAERLPCCPKPLAGACRCGQDDLVPDGSHMAVSINGDTPKLMVKNGISH